MRRVTIIIASALLVLGLAATTSSASEPTEETPSCEMAEGNIETCESAGESTSKTIAEEEAAEEEAGESPNEAEATGGAGKPALAGYDVGRVKFLIKTLPVATEEEIEATASQLKPYVEGALGRDEKKIARIKNAAVERDLEPFIRLKTASKGRTDPGLKENASQTVANASQCYGTTASTKREWEVYPTKAVIGWIKVAINGWCGIPGSRITAIYGPYYTRYTWGIYCLTGVSQPHGWDGSERWYQASLGVGHAGICLGSSGAFAVVRVDAKGEWDRYNDF